MGTNAHSDTPIIALAAEYNFMKDNTSDKVIAQTVLEHISEIPDMTLEEAAACCNVSVSTFLRFCRTIGYASYGAFKMKMTDAVENYHFRNVPFSGNTLCNSENFWNVAEQSISSAMANLKQFLDVETCRRLAEAIYQKKKIYIHDAMYSSIRLALQSDLAVSGKIVTFSPNNAQQKRDAEMADEDSLYFMDYDSSHRSKEVPNTIAKAKAKGAFCAVMSPTAAFPGCEQCDIILVTGKGDSHISSFLIHDLIYQYLSVIYRERYL